LPFFKVDTTNLSSQYLLFIYNRRRQVLGTQCNCLSAAKLSTQ